MEKEQANHMRRKRLNRNILFGANLTEDAYSVGVIPVTALNRREK